MGFGPLLPFAAEVKIAKTFVFIHIDVSGRGVCILEPDLSCRDGFFLPVRILSRLYRGLFLHCLEEAYAAGKLKFHAELQELNDPERFKATLKASRKTEWVVYSKPPFGGAAQALDWRQDFRRAVEPVFERLYDSVARGEQTRIVIEANSAADYKEKLTAELRELRESEMWRAGAAVRSLRPDHWKKH